MKKFFAVMLTIAMLFSLTAVASADTRMNPQDQIHQAATLDSYQSEAEVKVTINGVQYPGSEGLTLPTEYHIRVLWDVKDGVYTAIKSADDATNNFGWNCNKLDYYAKMLDAAQKAALEKNNWEDGVPYAKFEVTNASTPTLDIHITPSYLKDNCRGSEGFGQNLCLITCDVEDKTLVPAVTIAELGTGTEGRAASMRNVQKGQYLFNWNYQMLNQIALANAKTGQATEYFQTFVVTVTK